jgi:N-acyl-D-amino-acid deacylase
VGNVLVRGGSVVDGSGAPPFPADVRVRDGVIVEVGPGLVPEGETVFDAGGALVTPGFVDSHTHYDLEMFWDPTFDPLPLYGVTTTIMGNCGFGIAPTRADVQADIADLLCFVEELPTTLTTSIRWGWPTWSQYFRDASAQAVTVTPYAFVAHNALRATVLGPDAWQRAATDAEITTMTELLHDALASGALGMSSNWFDTDRARRLVPSRLSDDRELDALCAVLAAHRGSILQTIIRDDAQRHHVHRRARAAGVPVLSLGDGTGGGRDDGIDGVVHLGGGGEPSRPRLGFEASIATAAIPPGTSW